MDAKDVKMINGLSLNDSSNDEQIDYLIEEYKVLQKIIVIRSLMTKKCRRVLRSLLLNVSSLVQPAISQHARWAL